jgi:hypothetical protein
MSRALNKDPHLRSSPSPGEGKTRRPPLFAFAAPITENRPDIAATPQRDNGARHQSTTKSHWVQGSPLPTVVTRPCHNTYDDYLLPILVNTLTPMRPTLTICAHYSQAGRIPAERQPISLSQSIPSLPAARERGNRRECQHCPQS